MADTLKELRYALLQGVLLCREAPKSQYVGYVGSFGSGSGREFFG
jgi:hypothetical protein